MNGVHSGDEADSRIEKEDTQFEPANDRVHGENRRER